MAGHIPDLCFVKALQLARGNRGCLWALGPLPEEGEGRVDGGDPVKGLWHELHVGGSGRAGARPRGPASSTTA